MCSYNELLCISQVLSSPLRPLSHAEGKWQINEQAQCAVNLIVCSYAVQELKAAVEAKEEEKVTVQKQLHELQIQGRSREAPAREDHEAVQGIIGDMEAHGIGKACSDPNIYAMSSMACDAK